MATALAVAFAACWRFLWQRLNELRNVDAVGGFTGFSFSFFTEFSWHSTRRARKRNGEPRGSIVLSIQMISVIPHSIFILSKNQNKNVPSITRRETSLRRRKLCASRCSSMAKKKNSNNSNNNRIASQRGIFFSTFFHLFFFVGRFF